MHLPLSSPTPELLNDLDDFDFYMFLTTFASSGIKGHLFDVFDWLKGQVCGCFALCKNILM